VIDPRNSVACEQKGTRCRQGVASFGLIQYSRSPTTRMDHAHSRWSDEIRGHFGTVTVDAVQTARSEEVTDGIAVR